MICLPIEYLNGWLFGIDVNRCKPEIRETLIKYKKECYQALHDYWFKGKAERSQNSQQIAPLALPEKPRKIQGKTRAPEGEYLYTREFSAMEIDHLAKLWDIAEEQHKFIESLTPLFEVMQSEQWFKQHSRALSCFNHHNYSYHILSEMCEDVEEWTGIMPSIRAVKMKGKYYSRF